MNAINPPQAVDHSTTSSRVEALPEDAADQAVQRTLRRTGRKPVRFNGAHLVEALGIPSADSLWYDLNIYRSVADAIIVELAARRGKLGEPDLLRVEVFMNLGDAAAWLQAYPCSGDIPVPAMLMQTDLPLAASVVQAVQLRQRIVRVEEEYQAMLCDVFAALGLADSPEELLAGALHEAA